MANFNTSINNLVLTVNAAASYDPDGSISNYSWDFGDSTPKVSGSAVISTSHSYTTPGTYIVTLVVTDNNGSTNTKTSTVSVNNPIQNVLPVARFTAIKNYLSVSFDASSSTDADGIIVSYNWNLGNGVTNTNKQFVYSYSTAGSYTVTLTVTDDKQGSSTISQIISVVQAPINNPPTARFVISGQNGLTVNVDGSSSTDDGSIVLYTWNFGDGNIKSSTSPASFNTYVNAGTYTITLTVKDNGNLVQSTSLSVTVQKPNSPPKPSFTFKLNGLTVSFDASSSTDSDGNIINYLWNYGDGSSGNGQMSSHQYNTAGNYPVSLTVIDNQNAQTSTVLTVPVVLLTPPSCNLNCNINSMTASCVVDSTDTTVNSYLWNLGNGQTFNGNKNIDYTYQNAGSYQIQVTIKNSAGASSTCTKSITITSTTSSQPPLASFSYYVDSKIIHLYFNGTAYNGAQIVGYEWDFGDQSPKLTGQSQPVHTYSVKGNYTISLKVTDSKGAISMTSKIISIG